MAKNWLTGKRQQVVLKEKILVSPNPVSWPGTVFDMQK
jgi:hypothetical protein